MGSTLTASDMADTATLTTLDGADLVPTLGEGGGVSLGDTNIVLADFLASNGVVHVVDAALLPANPELKTKWRFTAVQR